MASTNTQRPLAVATQRIIDALLSLDAAVDKTLVQRGNLASNREKIQEEISASWQQHTSALESDIQSLEQKNTEVTAQYEAAVNELTSLKQQYIALQHTASKVAVRLDQSIEQLDMLMESA